MRFALLVVLVLGACKTRNPALCCDSPTDCAELGVSESALPCDDGLVCLAHQCQPPLDAASTPRCEGDGDCSAPTPYCNEQSECVECVHSEQCGELEPVCDATQSCRGCVVDEECASSVCDRTTGACVQEAAVLYVSPTGGEQATCARTDACSVTRAIALADSARRTIKMAGGSYTATLAIDKPLIVHGYGATINTPADAEDTILLGNGADVQVLGLAIINANLNNTAVRCNSAPPSPHLSLDEVSIDSHGSTMFIQNCTATVTRGRLQTRKTTAQVVLVLPTSTVMIDRTVLDGGNGVWGEGRDSVVRITNSVIKNQTGPEGAFAGSNLFGQGAGSVSVEFSTVINSRVTCGDAAPPCAGGTAVGSCIRNSIVLNGTAGAPADTIGAGCVANYTMVYPQSTALAGSNNVYGVNPMLVDHVGGDYHLAAGSPAIDAADPGTTTMIDFEGTPRPQGPRSDMGAFEYKP